ncbi:MAG: SUMF1/EgtB/PvdO family nonheme iron enzyme [Nitrospirota bacterium]
MDKLFIRSWFLFVGLLSLVAYAGVRLSTPKQDTSVPLKSSGEPIANAMILIPAGHFTMGSDEGGRNEKPIRQVFLDAFEINAFEITQSQYGEFVKATRHRSPLSRYVKDIERYNDMNQPVVYVNWLDAEAFCKWTGSRLPTEAEWEKAARGSSGITWPWGNDPQSSYGNFLGDADQNRYTAFVGSFQKDRSPYQIYDMAGNAQEWVADWYEPLYYEQGKTQNPKGPMRGTMKILRGGSWNDSYLSGRASARIGMVPDYRDTTVGFRCGRHQPPAGVSPPE